ncbi:hypothetical protein BGZ93_011132 [Podila epicladia]|nr:hypothetical protein BGZ92_004756 [Podila epicladia]KAG0087124.1 hypothetical protein BGZ93_011132 [Podila epicladia]
MNLSAILNDPGTTLPTNHSRTKSGATSSAHEVHHFDNNQPILDDYYDHRSNVNNANSNNNGYHHNDVNNTNNNINASYTNGSESRKHASSVSVNQLEQLSALSNGNDNSLSGPTHDHAMNSHDYHPSESGKGKIRPNESNNTYSTSTFRAAPRASFVNSGKTTSPPSSSLSSPITSSSSPATFHTMTTVSSPSSLAPTTAITVTPQITTAAAGVKESSTNSPIAKKKPRQQQEIVFSSSDPSHDPDGRSSKKKLGRKTSSPTSGQGHDDPFEIRFVMTDKDGLDKSKNSKASASSSSTTTPATTSTPQDSQDEDTGDQDTSESSPQPDFERNAEGKYRCSWPRCGKEFTVASRLTTHFRIHNGKPPYLCGYKDCQKAFHTSSSLSHHRVVHTDQGLRPYICRHNRCGATYTQLARLITHQRTTHSGMILFIPQPNAQSEGTAGSTVGGTGTLTSSSSGTSATIHSSNTNSINNNTPTSTSPSTPSGASLSAQGQVSTISPISPRDRQRGATPVSMSGTSGTISPMGEPSRSPHEPPHDKNNTSRAYSYQAQAQAFSPTTGHGYPSPRGQTHRPETLDGRYEHSEQGPRDRPGDAYGQQPQQPREYSQDEEFDNEENLSPEERSRREAALTMTSFREIAMIQQHVPYEQQPPQPPPPPPQQQQQQQHPSQRHDYFGEQYYHGQPTNMTSSSRPGEYWNNQGDHGRMSEVDRGYSNYDDRRPSTSPGHPQYPNDRFYPGSNEHQNPSQNSSPNQNQARRP